MNQPSDKKGPLGYSQADKSEIKSVDEDKSEAQKFLLKLLGDQNQQREEIDSIKVGMEQITQKMQELIDTTNKQSQMITGDNSTTNQPTNQNSLIALKDILESPLGGKIIDRILPAPQQTSLLGIDNDYLAKELKEAFIDDLETGKYLRQGIKQSIKKNVVTKAIKGMLTSDSEITHEPA